MTDQEYQKFEDIDPPPDPRQQNSGDIHAPHGASGDDPGPPEDYAVTIEEIERYPAPESS